MRRAGTFVAAALCVLFATTGPWRIGATTVRQWQYVFAVCALMLLSWARTQLTREIRFRPRTLVIFFIVAALFLLWIAFLRYDALEVNAWDFSNSFDRPIEQTLHGNLLWSDTIKSSMLALHANWLTLIFVPLYAVIASPYWLVAAQPLAIIGAMIFLFLYARDATGDDVVAMCVALAFLLNRYTVRAMQLGFLIDVFYPLGFLLLLYAFQRKKPGLGLTALLLILSIKEDAILTLAGFAVVAALSYRQWRWAIATVCLALAVFAFDYFYVLPGFSGHPAAFSSFWGTFGATPWAAVLGMIRHPLVVLRRVWAPAFSVLATVAFVPLAGGAWFLAALPTIVVYTSADTEDMHWLALHYSLPFLGLLFASLPNGIERLAKSVKSRRLLAIVVLGASTFVGSGYKMERPRPERAAIAPLLAAAGARPVYIQGALFPHAGYARNRRVLHHDVTPEPTSAFLLCTTCNPYPFSRDEFAQRFEKLRSDPRYVQKRAGDLWLFKPAL
jgi:uncharacterized membrane protein